MKYDFYKDGLKMLELKHKPEVSCYNNNYYIGNGSDLLFGKSDDDNTTEWWAIEGEENFYLGESYTSEGDELHRYESKRT